MRRMFLTFRFEPKTDHLKRASPRSRPSRRRWKSFTHKCTKLLSWVFVFYHYHCSSYGEISHCLLLFALSPSRFEGKEKSQSCINRLTICRCGSMEWNKELTSISRNKRFLCFICSSSNRFMSRSFFYFRGISPPTVLLTQKVSSIRCWWSLSVHFLSQFTNIHTHTFDSLFLWSKVVSGEN